MVWVFWLDEKINLQKCDVAYRLRADIIVLRFPKCVAGRWKWICILKGNRICRSMSTDVRQKLGACSHRRADLRPRLNITLVSGSHFRQPGIPEEPFRLLIFVLPFPLNSSVEESLSITVEEKKLHIIRNKRTVLFCLFLLVFLLFSYLNSTDGHSNSPFSS